MWVKNWIASFLEKGKKVGKRSIQRCLAQSPTSKAEIKEVVSFHYLPSWSIPGCQYPGVVGDVEEGGKHHGVLVGACKRTAALEYFGKIFQCYASCWHQTQQSYSGCRSQFSITVRKCHDHSYKESIQLELAYNQRFPQADRELETELRVLHLDPQAAGRETLDLAWTLETSKPTHGDVLPPRRPHPLQPEDTS